MLLQEIVGSRNMRVKYCCDAKAYENYYLSQVGHGMPYFAGSRVQQGYGLGNLFNSIAKSVLPLVKKVTKPWETSVAKRCRVCFRYLTSGVGNLRPVSRIRPTSGFHPAHLCLPKLQV